MLQLTAKTQAEINKQSAASNKTPLLGGPAPYGPGIPTGMPARGIVDCTYRNGLNGQIPN